MFENVLLTLNSLLMTDVFKANLGGIQFNDKHNVIISSQFLKLAFISTNIQIKHLVRSLGTRLFKIQGDCHGKNNQQQRYTQNYRLPWKEQPTTAIH